VGKYFELRHIEHYTTSKWYLGAGLPASPIISRKKKEKKRGKAKEEEARVKTRRPWKQDMTIGGMA
jgi:hypothetical protein